MSEYRWLTEMSQQYLNRHYLVEGQSVDERVDLIANNAERILGIKGFADKFKEYFKKGWYSLSTPIWANFGVSRGLPISCFGSYIGDSVESIASVWAEVCMQTKLGGGTSGYFGDLRSRGSKIKNNGESSGSVHFMKLFENLINVISQGSTRRGNFAAYLPIEHPDILEFLTLHTDHSDIKKLSFGVTVTDDWMNHMIEGDPDKRRVWAKVLESRANLGFPYIVFIDNANNNTVDVYKDKGMKINQSNLCTEIFLPNNDEESFVCDLSSMNAVYFDEWKDTDAVEVMTFFLDAVMSEFIEKAKEVKFMDRCVRFAERHRAIGIGVFGWHSYLQSKMIPIEGLEAKMHNILLFKTINEQAHVASRKLAEIYGEPEVLKGYGRRNTTLTAVAPTKSSSFIIGQASEGVEPDRTNYYIKDLQKGKYMVKNKYLEKILVERGQDTEDVWNSILVRNGSVQHLECLTEHEKNVFKTFGEISQLEIISQAADRQKYIDQGQSLNLLVHPLTPVKDINGLIIEAWKLGVKSLYYQHSINAAQDFSRNLMMSCKSCEG